MEDIRPNHRPPKERIIEPEALNRDYYTIYQVAEMLQFHHNTVRRMIKTGELPAMKYGNGWRIRKADLEEFTRPNNA